MKAYLLSARVLRVVGSERGSVIGISEEGKVLLLAVGDNVVTPATAIVDIG